MHNTWNVLLPKGIHPAGPEVIEDIATFTSIEEFDDKKSTLEKEIDRFDAVILRLASLDRNVIENAERLKVIAKHGTGLNNVDIEAATEQGIVVCNNPGVNARAVAEFTITLILSLRADVSKADAELREGMWNRKPYLRREIRGNVLGLLGCGNIGREVATMANGLGLRSIAYDPYVSESDLPETIEKVTRRELFEQSDIVSVHVPLTDETRHSISTDELELLSEEDVLINTSRGSVVDEEALLAALENETIGGAALDAFEEEPIPRDHPILQFDNTIVTPHIAGGTVEARRRNAELAAEKVRTVYDGGLPEHTVNADRLQTE